MAATEPLSVMALMAEIHALDETFACRSSTCFKGQCGSCLVRVNGRDALGCVTMVQPGETVTLEPHSKYRVVRSGRRFFPAAGGMRMGTVRLETEVLVVGVAQSRTACGAGRCGSRQQGATAQQGPVARSGITLTAAGGMQAPLHPEDSCELFLADTLRCGYEIADKTLAWTLATEAAGEVREMERYGVKFVRDERGELALGRFLDSRSRAIFLSRVAE